MPIRVPAGLPAIDELSAENIFVIGRDRALRQDIRALRLLVLNLMPLKQALRHSAWFGEAGLSGLQR